MLNLSTTYGSIDNAAATTPSFPSKNKNGTSEFQQQFQQEESTEFTGEFSNRKFSMNNSSSSNIFILFLTIAFIVITRSVWAPPPPVTLVSSSSNLPSTSHHSLMRGGAAFKSSQWTAVSSTVKQWIGLSSAPWQLYKRTFSANKGTNPTSTLDWISYFFTSTSISQFGCNSNKVVAYNAINDYTSSEFHFVDSGIFYDDPEKPVEDWNAMISELGFDTYNQFMNNYVQLYTTDLSAVMSVIKSHGYNKYFAKLSTTPKSSVLNVAHLYVFVENVGVYIDMVAPLSSVSDKYLSEFTEWSADECAGAHQLKYEHADYQALLSLSTNTNADWEASTGLTTPLFIATGIPTTSLSKVDDIFTMAGTITNVTETTVIYDTCSYREMIINAAYGDDTVVTSTMVRYIAQPTAANGPDGFTLSDWEDLHDQVYDHQKAKDHAGKATWSRFMDYHIGIESDNSIECTDGQSMISAAYAAVDSEYVISIRGNLHYYTGVPGIVSWEYNAVGCDGNDGICGCDESNSKLTYLAMYNDDTCGGTI